MENPRTDMFFLIHTIELQFCILSTFMNTLKQIHVPDAQKHFALKGVHVLVGPQKAIANEKQMFTLCSFCDFLLYMRVNTLCVIFAAQRKH